MIGRLKEAEGTGLGAQGGKSPVASPFDQAVAMPTTLGEAGAIACLRAELMRQLEDGELAHAALHIESMFEAHPHAVEVIIYSTPDAMGCGWKVVVEPPGSADPTSTNEHSRLLRMLPRAPNSAPTNEDLALWAAAIELNNDADRALGEAMERLRGCSQFMDELQQYGRRRPLRITRARAPEIASALGFPRVGAAMEGALLGKAAAEPHVARKRVSL